MPILDKKNKEQVEKYNEFVRTYENASVMQDMNWANVKTSWIQECIYVEKNEKIVAAMSILLEKIPFLNSYLMYAPRGPVCDLNDIDLVNRLVKEAHGVAKKYNAFLLKFDPELIYDEKIEKLYKENGYVVLSKDADKDELIQPRFNMILNVKDKNEDELFKSFSEKTRYNIRLSGRKGVKVRYSNSTEDLKSFYELYKITTLRDKIGCRAYEYFENMLKAYDPKNIRIYVASHENQDLSAAIALNYGGKLFYIYGASSNEKRNLMPNYLMQWEMIKWAIETKCNFYDFGGVLILDEQNGLYRFKIGFCKNDGVTEFIGEINKVYKPFIYFLYSKMLPKLKKIKRKFRKK